MAKSRARYLAELLTSEGLVQTSLSALAGADGIIDLEVLPTIPNSQLEHSSVSIAGHSLSLGGSLSLDTADIGEHVSYLYFTNARARAALSVSGSLSYDSGTGVISYTTPTTISSLSNHTTDGLTEGSTNLYYTSARANTDFDTRLATKSTTDLSEGTNLYYTDARVGSYLTSNSYATQTYVSTAISNLVDSAPATLDTLNELAAALGDDANFSTTVTNSIATKWTQDNTKISNWDTAYGWGNHASAGYQAASTALTTSTTFGGDVSGTYNAIVVANNSHEHSQLYENSTITYGASYLQWTDLSGQNGTGANGNAPQNPTNDWYHHIIANHASGSGYYYDLSLPFHQDELFFRRVTNGSQGSFQKVWHGSNDGSGSGLDADLLDGVQASSFLRSDAADTFTGNLTTGADNHITFGPNTSWGSSLRVGGNGRTATGTEMASVVTTDGNLHLDAAASNNAIYLGFYAGSSGTVFGSGASSVVARMDTSGNLYKATSTTNSTATYWHSGNDGSGSGLDADLLDGYQLSGATSVATKIFNNKGQNHSTYTDFNTVMTPGPNYLQAGNNGPGASSQQFYGIMFGLGNDYGTSTGSSGHYASQMYYPRASQGGSPYLYFRDMESGAWGSWRKVYAGYADNADLLDGLNASTSATANTIAARDAGGDLYQRYGFAVHFNQSSSNSENPTIGAFWTNSTSDNYNRKASPAHVISQLGLWTSGNDGSGSGLDADLLDGWHRTEIVPTQSVSDFVDGTLVTTSINAAVSSGDSFVIEVTGKAYGSSQPHSIIAEGYIYNNTFINYAGVNIAGTNFTYLKVMNNNGYLSFWWPRHGYWNSYSVTVRSSSGGSSSQNRVTSIANSADPAGATKKITINLEKSWHSGNDGSGSGLDADLLDGQHGSYYAASSSLTSHTGDSAIHQNWGLFSTNGGQDFLGRGKRVAVATTSNLVLNYGGDFTNVEVQSALNVSGSITGAGVTSTGNVLVGESGGAAYNALSNGNLFFSDTDLGDALAYSIGLKRLESISGNYTKLNIDWHTGITLGASPTYGGVRFFDNSVGYYNSTTKLFSVGELDSHVRVYNNLYIGGNTAWHAGNDGSGSGLDADTVDGFQSTALLRFVSTFGSGQDWNSLANTSYTMRVDEPNNGMGGTGAPGNYSYGQVWSSKTANSNFQLYASHIAAAGDGLRYRTGWVNGYYGWVELWDSANDGSGSGLDADLLDGRHASDFVEHMDGTRTDGANLNSYLTSGFYNTGGGTIANKPSGASDYAQLIVARGIDTGLQIYGGYTNSTLYARGWHQSGNFFGWSKLWSDSNDGSGSGLDADTVDGVQASNIAQLNANQTFTSNTYKYFQVDRGGYCGATNTANLQAFSSGNNSAFMSFHKGGHYAVNMGLDADNVLRIGGWSASANRWVLDMSGNMTAAGNVTAYSDIRLKENIKVIPDALEKVQKIRGVTFTRNDQEDKEKLHTGVIAQEVELVLPEVISEDNLGIKNVAYGNMVGLLIEAIKELKAEVDDLKAQLKEK